MLYNIIKQLQDTPSTNDKLSILKANKDNELLKEYLRLVCCPSVSFYITAKTFPVVSKIGTHTFQSLMNAGYSLGTKELSQRHVTGQAAKNFIVATMEDLDEEHQQLYKMLLLKDIRAKVGATLVNKVWPNLCVSVPYMRCSLPDEKTLEKFKKAEKFIVQTKGDGMFASLVLDSKSSEKTKLFTRNGSKFPAWFAEYLATGLDDDKHVYEGELICFKDGVMLSRQQGNGILNSIMQGEDMPANVCVCYYVWNRVDTFSWKNGKESNVYVDLFQSLVDTLELSKPANIKLIDHKYCVSLEEAYAFNNEQLAKGLEGSIIKTLTHKWKEGTSKECLKLKLAVEIDLIVESIEEATGKDAGCAGRIQAKSSCGILETGINCTGEYAHRKFVFENKEQYIGRVFTCVANDIVDNELKPDKKSLFLGRSDLYNEIRHDKTQADDVERIHAMFNAAKGATS